jgi:hypothetical protein
MALQSADAIALTALSVINDEPPDSLQPRLVDAIHLRWSFGATRAFPWHGYYLLRRLHHEARMHCLQDRFAGLLDQSEVSTSEGIFRSDASFKRSTSSRRPEPSSSTCATACTSASRLRRRLGP